MPVAGSAASLPTKAPIQVSPPGRARRETAIVVIGGGPAGLAVGFELQRRGLPFVILERGAAVGESWRRMPRNLKLVSPWKCNSLPGIEKNLFSRHDQISREQ